MNAIRKNMLSEHRSRVEGKRDDLRSSGNSRISIPGHQFKAPEKGANIELLTFYPKGKHSLCQFVEPIENEFIDDHQIREYNNRLH